MNEEDEKLIRWDKARKLSAEIMDCFEELLEEKGIDIPSTDREGRAEGECEEARIYGTEYYDLEDKICDLLRDNGVREE
jgi:hypothetical protein